MNMTTEQTQDPMDFLRQMWGNMGFSLPGMVTPTFDTLEISKRIADLKAVEGWLRMNLSMLQMTIQGLEMQNTTLSAVQAMGKMATQDEESGAGAEGPTVGETLHQAAMWPWQVMQQVQDQLQQSAAETQSAAAAAPEEKPAKKEAPAAKAAPRKPAKKTGQ
jgi:hypothetical protein